MDPEIWKTLLSAGLLGVVGAVGWLVKTVISNGAKFDGLSTKEDLEAHRAAVADLAAKTGALEAQVEAADFGREVRAIHGRIDEVAGSAARVEGQLGQLTQTVHTIHQHLLEDPRR